MTEDSFNIATDRKVYERTIAVDNLNLNPAYSTSFRLIIPGAAELNYFIQSVPLPGISISNQSNLFKNMPANLPGNGVSFDPLNVRMVVDEDLRNYSYLLRWILKLTKGPEPLVSLFEDLTLHITDTNKINNRTVVFYGAYPTSISSLDFNSAVASPEPLIADVSFQYQYFDIVV